MDRPRFIRPKKQIESDEEESIVSSLKLESSVSIINETIINSTTLKTDRIITSQSLNPILKKQQTISTDDLNKLKSKIMKAELTKGNELDSLKLEYELEQKKRLFNSQVDMLPSTNQDACFRPHSKVKSGHSESNKSQKLSKNTLQPTQNTHDLKGNRLNYANDQCQKSLQDLVDEERSSSALKYDTNHASHMMKNAQSKNLDEQDDSILNIGTFSKKHKHNHSSHNSNNLSKEEKEIAKLDKCLFCYTPERVPLVSVVALATRTYLGLMDTVDLTPGHCFIAPTMHVRNTLECEDDVWDEIRVHSTYYTSNG